MSEETQEQIQIDPVVEKAKSAGWRPLEEFDGDQEQWVDAKEFVSRAPLYEKNHKLKREVADLKTTVHEMKQHITKVSQAAYNKAVADLNARRDEAIELGDKDQVKAIDKEIKQAESIKVEANELHPAITAWVKENEWFDKDDEMNAFAVGFNDTLIKRNPNMSIEESLEKTKEAVVKAFPDKFENPKRKNPPAVETGSGDRGKKIFTKSDLNDEQRKVMSRFVRQGIMTEDDYIKELADSGIIGGKK